MMHSFPLRLRWIALLALLGTVWVAEIVWLNDWYGEYQRERTALVSPEAEVSEGDLLELPPLPGIDPATELRERPLFVQGRRPVDVVAPVAEPEPVGASGLQLTSTILVPEKSYALVRDANSGRTIVLRPGDTQGRWMVDSIEADRVVLRAGTDSETLRLRPDSQTKADRLPPDARLELELPDDEQRTSVGRLRRSTANANRGRE